jgi:F-type H+-transporting ATPase subunit a
MSGLSAFGSGAGVWAADAPPEDPMLGLQPLDHIARHSIDFLGGISNHLFMLLVSAVLLVIVVPVVSRARGVIPRGAYNVLEAILQFLREEVARPSLGRQTDTFIPFIWTFFFLILTANLLGILPLGFLGASIDAHLAHLGGTATGNLSITAALAICAFLVIHVGGMARKGPGHYWKEMFFGHAPIWLAPLMVPLEIIGALVKPFALAIRLFANMIAGHIVLGTIVIFGAVGLARGGAFLGITVAALLGGVAIMLLEVFVAFLQAYIFTYLTTLFIGMAVHTEH